MSEYVLTWLPYHCMYRQLRQIAKRWPQNDKKGVEGIGLVLYEVWAAVQGQQSFPDVCVLTHHEEYVGVLCGLAWPLQRNFYIQHVVVCQHQGTASALYEEIQHKLVESAIDFSQELGFHGWVSCSLEEGEKRMWRNLGFSPGDDHLTHRRMGYFTRL